MQKEYYDELLEKCDVEDTSFNKIEVEIDEKGYNSKIKRYYIRPDELLSIFERVFNNEKE